MPVVYVRKAPLDDAILRAAERMEPKLRKAFLDAVKSIKDSVSIKDLEAAVRSGDVNRVMNILSVEGGFTGALQGGKATVADALRATFTEGVKAALSQLPKKISVNVSFSLKNPKTVQFLEKYTFNRIKEMSKDSKTAIREVITRAFQEGSHPYEQARKIRGAIGLTSKQSQAVDNYRRELESGSTGQLRQALSRSLRDGRYDRGLAQALADKTPLPQARIDVMVDRYAEKYVKYRAETIARTESIRASNQGQRELWADAQEQGLLKEGVKRQWITSGDDRTCPVCSSLDGEVRDLDEEFDDGIMDPPDPHPDCRCSTSLDFGEAA